MPEEYEAGDDLTQEETDQAVSGENPDDVAEDITNEDVFGSDEATVEGFDAPIAKGVDRPAQDVEDDTEKQSEEGQTPTGQEEKKDERPSVDYLKNEVNQLRGHIQNLNVALHQERQAKAQAKAEDENPLTEAQIRNIYKEHSGDPDTMFNVIQYQIQQAMKQSGQETLDTAAQQQKQQLANQYIASTFPQLNDPSNPMRHNVDAIKQSTGLTDHPLGDLAGLGMLFLNNLPQYSQMVYQAGQKASLTNKADESRKANVKGTKPAPSGKKTRAKRHSSGLTGQQLDTAKQMGLSDKQMKIYSKFLGRQTEDQIAEAM